jgi:hypothetical protein
MILGDRRFVELPGDRRHELPPLLLRVSPEAGRLDHALELAGAVVDGEGILPVPAELPVPDPHMDLYLERRRTDLALQLVEQYAGLIAHWNLGDSILEWIRQCEITFGARSDLRPLLRPDVWPHAGRSSFVTLLRDKAIDTLGLEPERAVGMRLSFRQPPPLDCLSDQFLILLKSSVASSAYRSWQSMTPDPVSSLPPERFSFDVIRLDN